jgi:hypothetical protein
MQMANHLSPDKLTEELMAKQVCGNKDAELSRKRRLEKAGGRRKAVAPGSDCGVFRGRDPLHESRRNHSKLERRLAAPLRIH